MEQRSLRSIRIDLGLSQKEMAEKLGIARSTYARKEQGKSPLLAWEMCVIWAMSGLPLSQIEVLR